MNYEEFVTWFINEHLGHENAVSRSELRLLTKNDDRVSREYIAMAREDGCIIINIGKVYFLVDWDDPEDNRQYMRFYAVELKRRDTLIKDCETYKKYADAAKEHEWKADKRENVAS